MVATKQYVYDTAMNLTRIGNWAADGFDERKDRIHQFLHQTQGYFTLMQHASYPSGFQSTIERFISEFQTLYEEGISKPKNVDVWAEKMMTWGNILTHRASLL